MKFGPIICDPNSNEAKCLRGKRVVSFRNYTDFNKSAEERYSPMVVGILNTDDDIFVIKDETDKGFVVAPFIAEIIEEKPKYRPYESCEEMVEDFKKRFCSNTTIPKHSMPLIWLNNRNIRCRFLVATFGDDAVHLNGNEIYSWMNMGDLFRYMEYLDGSPVGKEVKDD